jgi:lipopolysaccharide transport system ATP-binding protein
MHLVAMQIMSQEMVASSLVNSKSADKDLVLSVQGLSKKFCRDLKRSLLYGVQDITGEILGLRQSSETLRPKEFWALKDVDLQLRRGEAIGLVGKNGSGKSTLLRMISGLIKPDTGQIEVNGRIAPLIALGAGFKPVLTGRENIYANMSILGLSAQEIDERFDEVVEFAEIGDAIDAPVQTYSSGMAARLGFACAIYTEPDILLLDEVLAVGDVKFRAKCYRRLGKLRDQGTAFVLVSHSPNSILSLCESAVYLAKGKMIMAGESSQVMRRYEQELFTEGTKKISGTMTLPAKSQAESLGLDITSLYFRDAQGDRIDSPESGQPAYFCVACKTYAPLSEINLNLTVKEQFSEGENVLGLSTLHEKVSLALPHPGENELQMAMPYVGLRPNFYMMNVHVRQGAFHMLDSVEGFEFCIGDPGGMSQCHFYQPHTWKAVHQESIVVNQHRVN